MKRFLFLALLPFLLLALLTGCAADTGDEVKIGYISNLRAEEKLFDFDEIVWIEPDDTDLVEQYDLDVEWDFPNGFNIKNPSIDKETCTLSRWATFTFIDWKDDYQPKSASLKEFVRQHNEYYVTHVKPYYEAYPVPPEEMSGTPYWVTFKNGVVIRISQQYLP